jgi:hypothetical protein
MRGKVGRKVEVDGDDWDGDDGDGDDGDGDRDGDGYGDGEWEQDGERDCKREREQEQEREREELLIIILYYLRPKSSTYPVSATPTYTSPSNNPKTFNSQSQQLANKMLFFYHYGCPFYH